MKITMNSKKSLSKQSKGKIPQGFLKLKNYFESVVKLESFQRDIQKLREEYAIPENGFKPPKYEGKYKNIYPIRTFPEHPPKEWKYINNNDKGNELAKRLINLIEKFSLFSSILYLLTILEIYLFYNINPLEYKNSNTIFDSDSTLFSLLNLCAIEDLSLSNIFLKPAKNKKFSNKEWEIFMNTYTLQTLLNNIEHTRNSEKFPIAIRISPYASERDILDFVKKNFKTIYFLQKIHQKPNIKIGKIRQKNVQIQKRNEFIWQHRDLSRKKIMHLVNTKFKGQVLGYADIEKIIVLENKKRKEL